MHLQIRWLVAVSLSCIIPCQSQSTSYSLDKGDIDHIVNCYLSPDGQHHLIIAEDTSMAASPAISMVKGSAILTESLDDGKLPGDLQELVVFSLLGDGIADSTMREIMGQNLDYGQEKEVLKEISSRQQGEKEMISVKAHISRDGAKDLLMLQLAFRVRGGMDPLPGLCARRKGSGIFRQIQ